MQRLLSGYLAALATLHGVVIAALFSPTALGAETAWEPMSSEAGSTLSAQVVTHNFDLPAAVFVMIGQDAKPETLQLGPAQSTQPSRSLRNQHSKPIASPFTKWISPQASVLSKAELTQPAGESLSTAKPIPTPQVARRVLSQPSFSRKATSRRESRSTASQGSSNRNLAKSDNKTRSKKESARKHPTTKTLSSGSFPTPVAELTTPSARINPANLPPLTQGQQRLRAKVRRVLNYYYQHPLNTRDRGPWEMMHALLSYEVESKFLRGGPKGKPTSAVGWLCFNQVCKRRTLMYVDKAGQMKVRVGPALQGHQGQLLSMLAQSKVSRDYPIRIEGHDFTVGDLAKTEMKTCYPRTELTFKLIGLMHYLDSDATWMNDRGMQWDIPRLISEEIRQPIRGVACGGTHRLSGLTLAYQTRQLRGEPVDGQYLKAKKLVARYQQYAYRLQNRDGSFSTEWFRGPGNEKSVDRKFKTTGHQLEWLLYAASEKQLRGQKMASAANYLATIMYNNRNKKWEAGPLGHSIHALLLYDRMVFSPYDELKSLPLAGKSRRSSSTKSKR